MSEALASVVTAPEKRPIKTSSVKHFFIFLFVLIFVFYFVERNCYLCVTFPIGDMAFGTFSLP